MSGPPWTDWISLQKFAGTYAALVTAFPAPNIWTGFWVFTSDRGWCFWSPNQGWVALTAWLGNTAI
jgi:hypothetical protein